MEFEEFLAALKSAGLSRNDFAKECGFSYRAICNWKHGGVPDWAVSFLKYYKKCKDLEAMILKEGVFKGA